MKVQSGQKYHKVPELQILEIHNIKCRDRDALCLSSTI